ncbi:hypothetical protein SPPR111872_00380 [Sphingobacterium prati]
MLQANHRRVFQKYSGSQKNEAVLPQKYPHQIPGH